MKEVQNRPDSLRALEVLALALLAKSIQQSADSLCVTRGAVVQQNSKWINYYCEVNAQDRMKIVVVKAMDDGMRRLLFRKFKNHKVIGPLIKKWREGRK